MVSGACLRNIFSGKKIRKSGPAIRRSEKVLAFSGMGDDERCPAPARAAADIEEPVAPEVLGAGKGAGGAADRAAGGRGMRQCVPPFLQFFGMNKR
jgi:hypothetical protein